MKKNIGKIDQSIRIVLGVVLLVVAFFMENWIIGVIALIPIFTAVIRWCPLYCPLNMSTCGDKCDS